MVTEIMTGKRLPDRSKYWLMANRHALRFSVSKVVSGKSTHLATATFTNGTLSGSAGCNNFTASYQAEGNRLTIGPAATTRKHCAEPDGIMQQEQEYLDALARVRTYTLKTGLLELRDENGSLQVSYRVQED